MNPLLLSAAWLALSPAAAPARAEPTPLDQADTQARLLVREFREARAPQAPEAGTPSKPLHDGSAYDTFGCPQAAQMFEQGQIPDERDLAGEHLGVTCFSRFPGREYAARLVGVPASADGTLKLFDSAAAATDGRGYAPGFYDALPLTPETMRQIIDQFLPDYSTPRIEGASLKFEYHRLPSGGDAGYRRAHELRRFGSCLLKKDTDKDGLDSISYFCRHRPSVRPAS